jgi:hypothetical protein
MTAPTGIGYQKSFRFWLEFNRLFVEFFRLAVGLPFTARSTSEMRATVWLLLCLSSILPLVMHELSLVCAPPQWFAALPPIAGFVLNKNETSFAPLYWDRYAQIKPAR